MQTKTESKCSKCGKASAASASALLTGWLFRQAECNCEQQFVAHVRSVTLQEKSALEVRLVAPTAHETEGALIHERYQVVSLLGTGGMGSVYRVLDLETKTERALKLIIVDPNDSAQSRRLENEAAAVRSLSHPNIVGVQEDGRTADGKAFLLMDYIAGTTLSDLLEVGELTSERTLGIATQIVLALQHAHDHGVVHRDLKPSNVLITKLVDGRDVVKIVDFGIAQVSQNNSEDKIKLTQTGELIGSPLYMSPEQCKGDQLDARSDIYSLGCILFQCLTGRPPFEGENPVRVLLKHISEEPPSLPATSPVNKNFSQVIKRCLAKDPADRYQSAAMLLADLERIRDNKKVSGARSRLKKSKTRILVLTSLVLLVTGGLAANFSPSIFPTMFTEPELSAERPQQVNGKTLADLDKAIEANPKSAQAFYERGHFHERRDERDNAIDDYTSAIKLSDKIAQAYYGRANMFFMQSQFAKSIEDINQLQLLYPNWSGTYQIKSRVECFLEKYHDSIASAKEGGRFNFLPVDELSRSYDALGFHKQALDAETNAIHNASNKDLLHYLHMSRARTYAAVNQLDDAQRDLVEATSIHQKNSQPWGELAAVYAAMGNMSEAERCIKKALALDVFPARAHRLEGAMYKAAGKWSRAAESYSTSTSLEPWFGPAFLERAQCEIAAGEMHSALLDLQKSVQLDPWSPSTHSFLALVQDQLGDFAEAKKHSEKAFSILPDLPILFVNQARISLNHGDAVKAIQELNSAIKLDPYLADAYQTRSIALDAIGRRDDARKDMQLAEKLGWKKFDVNLKTAPAKTTAGDIELAHPGVEPLKV